MLVGTATPSPQDFTDCLYAFFSQLGYEEWKVAVNAFDVLDVLEKSGILKTSSIDGRPFKIRVRYGSDVNHQAIKHVTKILQERGFQRVGNTLSWVFEPKPDFKSETD